MKYWSSVALIAALIACGARKDTQSENEDSTYDHQRKADSIKIPPDEVVIAGNDSLPFVFAPRIENGWGSSIYTPPRRATVLIEGKLGRIGLCDIETEGGVDSVMIRKIIQRRAPDLLRSYEALLKEDPHVVDETWVRVKSGGHGVNGLMIEPIAELLIRDIQKSVHRKSKVTFCMIFVPKGAPHRWPIRVASIDRRSLKIGEKENVSDYGDEEPTEERGHRCPRMKQTFTLSPTNPEDPLHDHPLHTRRRSA